MKALEKKLREARMARACKRIRFDSIMSSLIANYNSWKVFLACDPKATTAGSQPTVDNVAGRSFFDVRPADKLSRRFCS
jgi:hypothetical protein